MNWYLTQSRINKLKSKIENNMSADIKLSKAQINKIIKSGGALGSLLARFLLQIQIKPAISLGKNILALLGLSADNVSSSYCNSQKKMYVHGTKMVKFSNNDLNDMTKIVKALEDSNVLIKGVSKTLKNDIKKVVL